jgi:hypothetical protein
VETASENIFISLRQKMALKIVKKVAPLPSFPVIVGTCLGQKAYRGFASLSSLAAISQADVFDQQKNISGTSVISAFRMPVRLISM